MKKLVFTILFLVGCTTCPNQDVIIPVYRDGVVKDFIRMPEGELDSPDNYFTIEEWNDVLDAIKQYKDKYGSCEDGDCS